MACANEACANKIWGTHVTNDIKTLAERIDTLETRVAYQDDTIETLNQTITTQWREIEVLTRQVAGISERLKEAEANAPAPSNEPPPHY